MPKVFFWSGGIAMGRSIEGLLRSLLWQLIPKFPEFYLDDVLVQAETHLGSKKGPPRSLDPIGTCTNRRVMTLIKSVTQRTLRSCNLCFFIDGLDEYGGDQEDLIDFCQDIVLNMPFEPAIS